MQGQNGNVFSGKLNIHHHRILGHGSLSDDITMQRKWKWVCHYFWCEINNLSITINHKTHIWLDQEINRNFNEINRIDVCYIHMYLLCFIYYVFK